MYIITVRRMISGEELKERKDFIIRKGYGRGCHPQAVFF
jgi:hypothetical protein